MTTAITGNITLGVVAHCLREMANLRGGNEDFLCGSVSSLVHDFLNFSEAGIEQVVVCLDSDRLFEALEWQHGSELREQKLAKLIELCVREIEEAREQAARARFIGIAIFSLASNVNVSVDADCRRFQDRLQGAVETAFDSDSNVHVIDVQSELNIIGLSRCRSRRESLKSLAPLSMTGARAISEVILRALMRQASPPRKVLVIDADNTLWGGVLGEVGMEGVNLSLDSYPGNVFSQAQKCFADLQSHGVLLVLLSKNEPKDVEEVLREHPHMILREDKFVVVSASWEEKASRMVKISEELNLSLDSFVFIDDSDFEIESVRHQIPEVLVIKVPAQPSNYIDALRQLQRVHFSLNADSDRTREYQIRARAESLKNEATSRESFLEQLSTRIVLSIDDAFQITRLAEMSQRTNQFNLSMRRLSRTDMEAIHLDSECRTIGVQVFDIFGDHGIAAGIIFTTDQDALVVSDMWVSCRVLGRGIEESLVAQMVEISQSLNCKQLIFRFVAGERNQQVESLLQELPGSNRMKIGSETGYWFLSNEGQIKKPIHIEMEIHENK